MKKLKLLQILALTIGLMLTGNVWGQTFYQMSDGNYTQAFGDITNWTNSYASGAGAANWRVATSVATSTVNTATVFVTGTTGGVQKGTEKLILLATGTNSTATDLLLNFTGRSSGTISLDYEKIVNSASATPRSSDLKIQYSTDNGATFTDLTGYTFPRVFNNSAAESGSLTDIALPVALDGQATVVIRFYVWNNGQTGGSGNRPKIAIDNISVTSTEGSPTPTITVSETTLTGFTYIFGNGPSDEQSFAVEGTNLTHNIVITPPTNYEISLNNIDYQSTSIELEPDAGTVNSTTIYVRLKSGLSVGSYNQDITLNSTNATGKTVACSGEVTAPPPPTITVDPSALSGFTYVHGSGPSAEQYFTVSGVNLTANISIDATTNYEISTGTGGSFVATNPITLTQSGGTVSETTIYVRLKAGLAIGTYNDEAITATSTDADNKTVTCSGSVTAPPPPDAPVANAATAVGTDGFTANWEAVSGATGYFIDVYTKSTAVATDLFISEYIEGSSNNKAIEIYNGTGSTVNLADYTIVQFNNGASRTTGTRYALTFTDPTNLLNGETYVIVNNSATQAFKDLADLTTTSSVMSFNGDDALAIYPSSGVSGTTINESAVEIDIFGRIGDDPGTDWTGDGGYTTVDKTLVRKSSVTGGITVNPTGTGPTAFTTLTTEWDMYNTDVITYLGSHTMGGGNVFVLENESVGNFISYDVTGLESGTTYYYVVRAENAYGTSDDSNEIEVETLAGNTVPVITSPTATTITTTTATLGGTITSDGGSTITERGTVWKTSAGVTIDDNKLAEGGTTAGTFTHSRTSLPAGTQIFYRAYATNDIGTTLSDEASFYTLAVEPTNHPDDFTAEVYTASDFIRLSWTDAEAGDQAPSGYLILANTTGSFSNPVDGTSQSDDNDLSDDVGVLNVAHGVEYGDFENLGLNTTYYFQIYSYNGTGSTINYKTNGTIPATDVSTPGPTPTLYQPQIFTSDRMIIEWQKPNGEFGTDWDGVIVFVSDGANGIDINASGIEISNYTDNNFFGDGTYATDPLANDNAYCVAILNTNENGEVEVWGLDELGPGGMGNPYYIYAYAYKVVIDGDDIWYDIVQSECLNFVQNVSAFSGTPLNQEIKLEWNDPPGKDEGFWNKIIIFASEDESFSDISKLNFDNLLDGTLTANSDWASRDENNDLYHLSLEIIGEAGVSYVVYNGTGNPGVSNVTITGLTNDVTYYFKAMVYYEDVNGDDIWSMMDEETSGTPYALPLIISEVADPLDNANARFVELFNAGNTIIDLETEEWYLSRQANGSNWATASLIGSISPTETFVISYSSANFLSAYGFNSDQNAGSVITGNGDDGYFLYKGGDHTTGTLVDAYGVIDEDGTGKPWEYEDARAVRNSDITAPKSTWTASEWTITDPANVADMTPGEHNGNVSWKGGAGNWNTAANWSNGQVPSVTDNVIVPEGALLSVDVPNATVNNINVQDGGELTINGSQSLTVSGTITIEDGGSFINNGTLDNGAKADADAVMQRHIPAYSNDADGWHLLASPVNNFAISGSDFEPGSGSPNLDDFYAWDETTYTWLNYKVGANNITNFVNGRGYLVAYQTTATKDFEGTFNNSNITHSNLSKGAGNGWHLLGNPFQSALQWTNTDWARINIAAGAKIMNSGGTYTDITVGGTDIIPANQGFFVQATVDASNTVTIPASQRVHNSTAFYKSAPANFLALRATDGVFYVETWIQIMDDATPGFDDQYDVNFLGGMYQAPQLYSKYLENERISTNRLALNEESATVQLVFKSFLDREFKITANGIGNFESNIDLILEDTQEGIQINLRETPEYTFAASANELTERFKLHLLKATGINEIGSADFNIYAHGGVIYLNGDKATTTQIEIFNTTGQRVFAKSIHVDGLTQINPQVITGWYVVKVSTQEGVATQKVFIR